MRAVQRRETWETFRLKGPGKGKNLMVLIESSWDLRRSTKEEK